MGWFSKAPASTDCVWLSERAKLEAIVRTIDGATRPLLVIAFFDASLAAVKARTTRAELVLARDVAPAFSAANGPDVCVVERHPLPEKNQRLIELLKSVTNAKPTFHASLDEPLMQRFGGERLAVLTQRLGLDPDEMISHQYVTKAFEAARQKIARAVTLEQPASSMAEWVARNVPVL